MKQYFTLYEVDGITYINIKTAPSEKEAERHLKSFEPSAKIIGTYEREKQPPVTWGRNGWVIGEPAKEREVQDV